MDVCVCIVDTSTTTHTFTLDLSTLERRERTKKNKMGECCTKGYAENKRGSRELDRGGGDLFYIKISKRRAFVWTSSHMSKENTQRPVISLPLSILMGWTPLSPIQ